MTLILGFRAKNGVVVASDRKVIRGGETETANKIFTISNVTMAFEGLTGIRDDFLLLLETEVQRARGFQSLYQVKLVVEDIVHELSQRYGERIGPEEAAIGVLIGGHDNLEDGRATLYFVHGEGYGEAVNYRCSGHGEEYAHTIAKFLYNPEGDVDENALATAFVISYVSDDVDMTVGSGVQVAIIKDRERGISFATDDVIRQAEELAKKAKRDLPRLFGLKLV